MVATLKTLISARYVSDAVSTEYTAGDGVTAIIDRATFTNIGTSNVDLTVWIDPTGTGAADSNKIVDAKTIEPQRTYTLIELLHVLESEHSVIMQCSAANSLVCIVSGREVVS